MNCRPGDLAIVVRHSEEGCPPRIGSIIQLTRISWRFPDCWMMEPPVIDPADGREVHIQDTSLRPIRDPGDDAVDESHAYLPPVPTHHKEPA